MLTYQTAGFTYCAIGALALLNRLPPEVADPASTAQRNFKNGGNHQNPGLSSVNNTIRWLISRMTTTIDEDEYEPVDDETDDLSTSSTFSNQGALSSPATTPESTGFVKLRSTPIDSFPLMEESTVGSSFYQMHNQWAGFNGRVNKIADTCYVFWVGGSLAVSF